MGSQRVGHAAAKSRLTLCDPVDGSPPGSSVHGILQARVLEWGATAFSQLDMTDRLSTAKGLNHIPLVLQFGHYDLANVDPGHSALGLLWKGTTHTCLGPKLGTA